MSGQTGHDLFALFARAQPLDPDARAAFLADLERRDAALARELESLLAEDEREGRVPVDPTESDGPRALVEEALGGAAVDPVELERDLDEIASYAPASERYEIREELGRGSMGRVHLTWDRALRRELAMKTIRRDKTGGVGSGGTLYGRFLNEARVTSRLDHPGIVPVHDLGVDADGDAYFTMQRVRGRDLREILELVRGAEEGWSQARVLGVLQRVCEAMAYAHSKGVIHRDLKPSNVMVGKFGEVYVMDWGVARVLGEPEERPVDPLSGSTVQLGQTDTPLVTKDGAVVGTPYFMPPEQARGELASIDQRSDVYAVGAMLYELLSGRKPYEDEGDTAHRVLARIVKSEPQPLVRLAAGAPSELIAICEKAMARNPADRYGDMGELAEDLRAFQERRVVRAYRTGALVELTKWIQRNRVTAAALGAAFLLFVGGAAAIAIIQSNNAERERLLGQEVKDEKQIALDALEAETLAKGVAQAETDRAQQEKAAADRALTFLIDMFAASNLHESRGREISAREILARGASRIEAELEEDPETRARLQMAMGEAYRSLGRYAEAEPLLTSAFETYRAELGESAAYTLEAMLELALLHKRSGNLTRAEELYTELVPLCRASFGNEHELTLVGLNNLGELYRTRGRFDRAEEILSETLELSRRVREPDNEDTLTLMNNLGIMYMDSGRLPQAEPLLEECFERLLALHGERYPITIQSRGNLARLRRAQGRFDEAHELMSESVELFRQVHGPEHSDFVAALQVLAALASERGHSEEALASMRECLEISRGTQGSDNPITLGIQSNLGFLLLQAEELEEAEEVLADALERALAHLGPSDRITLQCLGCLGQLYVAMDVPEEAEPLLLEVVDQRDALGPASNTVLGATFTLAFLYLDAGRHGEAEPLFVELRRRMPGVLGEGDAKTLAALEGLVTLYQETDRHAQALPLCERLLELTPAGVPERGQRQARLEAITDELSRKNG